MTVSPMPYYWSASVRDPLPPVPTRDQAIRFKGSMQGLTVDTPDYGPVPYWEGVVGWFDDDDRQRIYYDKRQRGDTHCGVQLSGAYPEPNQFYTHFPGKDWTQDLPGFRALLLEVIENGFYPWVPLAGDGLTYDPVGLTYGWSWLMNNLARVLDAVKDLTPYCLFCPGYDGVIQYDERTQTFGPWSIDNLNAFIVLFRQLCPTGYLSVEPAAGPLNGTLPNFLSPAAYNGLDAILNEFNNPPNDDVTWQGAARLLGPAYVRPPDQPPHDDPDAPFGPNSPKWSTRNPTPRGPIVGCAFEFDTYWWVRNQVTTQQVEAHREYLLRCGYPSAG